jgi:hypothetical protein
MNEQNRPPQSPDYPAAHSMDTTWFAVDKDGHVAAFDSAEGGAVPNEALNDQQGEFDPFEEVSSHSKPCGLIYTLDDLRSPLNGQQQHVQPYRRRRRPIRSPSLLDRFKAALGRGKPTVPPADEGDEELAGPVVLLPTDRSVVAAPLNEQIAVEIKCSHGLAVLFKNMPIELYRSLHAHEQCLGCYFVFSLEYGHDDFPPQHSERGIYLYSCCESQMAAPYGRHTMPERPLTVDQLPADLRSGLAKVAFGDLSFAETPYIQPVSHFPCFTWDGGYIDEDWKTFRANPGQEAEYGELYRNLHEDGFGGDFEFEPPTNC